MCLPCPSDVHLFSQGGGGVNIFYRNITLYVARKKTHLHTYKLYSVLRET